MKLIIPTIPVDFDMCISNMNWFFEFLPIDNIVFIGNKEVEQKIISTGENRFSFINENDIYKLSDVKQIIRENTDDDAAVKRAGWYYQQFLKLLYARQCEEEYYLIWDSDTVPVHTVSMFDDLGSPFFDMKTEYHKPYFETLKKVFNMDKSVNMSFISEHMMFNKKVVCEMIDTVEAKQEIKGKDFCEKILNVVAETGYTKLAFSEFETYGTYVYNTYPELYKLREWKSLRRGAWYFDKEQLDDQLIKWLAQYYDAISFEKGAVKKKMVAKMIAKEKTRKWISAKSFEIIQGIYAFCGRMVMKVFRCLQKKF